MEKGPELFSQKTKIHIQSLEFPITTNFLGDFHVFINKSVRIQKG